MNRIFKFRIWCNYWKPARFVKLNELLIFTKDLDSVINEFFNQKAYTVQQFTGLLDKNGKEIYEGDIIKQIENDGWGCSDSQTEEQYIIEFRNGCFLAYGKCLSSQMEIIGNIFENPELLK